MKLVNLMGALSLAASAPCILAAQKPAPAAPPAQPAARQEVVSPPARAELMERRAVLRRRVAAVPARAGRMGGAHAMSRDVASMLLAHTGELQLTDAQVTRLAAIARRAEARQKAMRARMDSAMTAMRSMRRSDSTDRPPMPAMRMLGPTEAERKAQHEDNREAFSVATADQLATAWEMMGRMHR